jgi:1-phosphofructokinase
VIITVTLNPAIDQTIEVDQLRVGDSNRILSNRIDIGGKGVNVARMLKELGYEPLAMGFAPGELGLMIEEQLSDAGIGTDFTFVPGETRTNVTIIDRERHVHTVLNAPGPRVSNEDMEEFLGKVRRRLRRDTWLVLAGSLPPPWNGDLYRRLIREAELQGALTALDADGIVVRRVLDEGGRPTLLKLNEHELGRVYGDHVETEDEAFDTAEQIRVLGVPAVIVTRGGSGAIALTPEADYRVRAPEVEVQSAIGAGDSFHAALLLALRRGEDWSTALRLGAAAGAACCLTPGTGLARRRDVKRLEDGPVVERVAAHASSS